MKTLSLKLWYHVCVHYKIILCFISVVIDNYVQMHDQSAMWFHD